jgi:hypothetical protein
LGDLFGGQCPILQGFSAGESPLVSVKRGEKDSSPDFNTAKSVPELEIPRCPGRGSEGEQALISGHELKTFAQQAFPHGHASLKKWACRRLLKGSEGGKLKSVKEKAQKFVQV